MRVCVCVLAGIKKEVSQEVEHVEVKHVEHEKRTGLCKHEWWCAPACLPPHSKRRVSCRLLLPWSTRDLTSCMLLPHALLRHVPCRPALPPSFLASHRCLPLPLQGARHQDTRRGAVCAAHSLPG